MTADFRRGDSVRVMIVDDSTPVRSLVSRWLEGEAGITVVGTAANGREALDLLDVLRPDIVLLDVDMPVLDGLGSLPPLLARRPDLSVIVVSTLTRPNAQVTLKCLALGAVDYLPKPEARPDAAGTSAFRRELGFKLKELAARHLKGPTAGKPVTPHLALRASPTRPRVVGIGASTGGPNALAQALPGLAGVSALVPILIVQHMPELFTRVLAEQLRIKTGLAVAEAEDGEPIEAGRVYLAPGGCHMGITAVSDSGATIRLDRGEPVHHCRPAIDILFADLARVFGPASLGIVLTGMGRDGTDGAAAIVGARGTIFAQDEATSTIWGMPGSVVRAGLARRVLPLGNIAAAVGSAVGRA